MEALVNNLQTMFHGVFGAHVTDFIVTVQNNAQPVYSMNANGPVGFASMGATETHMSFTVIEPDSAIVKDKSAHGVYNFMRKGMFDSVITDCAVLQNMRVSRDSINPMYRTELQLLIYDMDKFSLNLLNYQWKAYSDKFDELMEETLLR